MTNMQFTFSTFLLFSVSSTQLFMSLFHKHVKGFQQVFSEYLFSFNQHRFFCIWNGLNDLAYNPIISRCKVMGQYSGPSTIPISLTKVK